MKIRGLETPFLNNVAWLIASLAWKGLLSWIMALILWFKNRRLLAFQIALALIVSTIAGLSLKGIISRPRPDLYASMQLNIPMPELLSTHHSFPSGHTLMAAAFTFVLFFYYRDYRFWLAFFYTCLVGLARVYQGMHWPSDVIGSFILGIMAAYISVKIISPIMLHKIGFLKKLVEKKNNA
jgi:membrane-associated phospholipid phosphatase